MGDGELEEADATKRVPKVTVYPNSHRVLERKPDRRGDGGSR